MTLLQLPDTILHHIVGFLPPEALLAVMRWCTCLLATGLRRTNELQEEIGLLYAVSSGLQDGVNVWKGLTAEVRDRHCLLERQHEEFGRQSKEKEEEYRCLLEAKTAEVHKWGAKLFQLSLEHEELTQQSKEKDGAMG